MKQANDGEARETTATGLTGKQLQHILYKGYQAQYVLVHANKLLVFKIAHHFGYDKSVPFEDYVMVSISLASLQQAL